MSLNFFKTKPAKTDASLDYESVINNLNAMDSSIAGLDIDQFIQNESILLGKHQDFYHNEKKNDAEALPKQLQKDTQCAADDKTRALVNSYIELSKTMPDIKSEAIECNNQVKASILQNQKTIDDINKAHADLL
ncbi:hypothetical protein BD408DRAFT_448064 [Parasitella parasitica]|nr:hypothetical protein BD408DRAFT_448064 [Parasitella parasitica]